MSFPALVERLERVKRSLRDNIETGWRALFDAPSAAPSPPPPPPHPTPIGLPDLLPPPPPPPLARAPPPRACDALDLARFPYRDHVFRRAVYPRLRASTPSRAPALSSSPSPFFVTGAPPPARSPRPPAVCAPRPALTASLAGVRIVVAPPLHRPAPFLATTRRAPRPPPRRQAPRAPVVKTIAKHVVPRNRSRLPALLRRQKGKMQRGNAVRMSVVAEVWSPGPDRMEVDGDAMEMVRKAERDARVRTADSLMKRHAGLARSDIMEDLSPELVELMDQCPEIAEKIWKGMGKSIRHMVEARVRIGEGKALIQREESERNRLERRGKVDAERRTHLFAPQWRTNTPEKPPETAHQFEENYWSEDDDGWDEDDDDTALEEKERRISVTNDDSAFAPLSHCALKRLRHHMMEADYAPRELAKVNGCIITTQDLTRLKPGCWLNDEIVNAYLELLVKRNEAKRNQNSQGSKPNWGDSGGDVPKVKVMNSFFYTKLVRFNRAKGCSVYEYKQVRRWTRQFDVFSYDVMLIPINQANTHWTLGVINFKDQTVEHLDSMGTGGLLKVREHLMSWVRDEAADKSKPFSPNNWTMPPRDVPRQLNSDDCGVFLCKFADFISRGWQEFTFSQQHMNYFRSRIAHELLMERAT